MSPLLQLRDLTKTYGRAHALSHVNLDIEAHEVVGIVGQNGAGKSTLLKLLAGVVQPTSGEIILRDQQVTFRGPSDASRAGIGIVHQEQALVSNLTVAENIFLGRDSPAAAAGIYRWKRLNKLAADQLAKTSSELRPDAVVDTLSFAERQMVELTKVLTLEESVRGDMVILFDEPTSVLSASEINTLFDQIRRLKQRASVLFVSHRMDEVLAVSDRVYVMREGKVVAERRPDSCDERELYQLMVGTHKAEDYYLHDQRHAGPRSDVVLNVEGAASLHRFQEVSFDVAAGEIVGLAGVAGSGREDVCRAIFGAMPLSEGAVRILDKPARFQSPRQAVNAGVGYLPAERKHEGMITGRSVAENLTLSATAKTARGGLVRAANEKKTVAHYIDDLQIKTPGPEARIESLSGGNQQKVVLAKWLSLPNLKLLILDHPTRGLDLGAKVDVYRQIRAAAANGVAILLMSDTLEELLGLSDRIVVMRDGRVTKRFSDVSMTPVSPEAVVEHMV